MLKIKNWEEFQHFKDRTPPWIKLYRYILDDPDWHELSGDDAKTLVMLWLIASEDKNMNGELPDIKKISFRLRKTEAYTKQALNRLSNWLIQDDNSLISSIYQHDAPEERRGETETDTKNYLSSIDKTILSDYMKVRKSKKAGDFTETAFNGILREAEKCGLNINQALAYCCKRSWVGFESSWYLKDNPKSDKPKIQQDKFLRNML